VFGYQFPDSISQTGTLGNQVGAVLPFLLGAFALYAVSYAIVHAYDRIDSVLTINAAIGFAMVAMFPCLSPYIVDSTRVGIFAMSELWSDILHSIGAIGGFGCLIFWILRFRKSNLPEHKQTKEKLIRNRIYLGLFIGMVLSLSVFIADGLGAFQDDFPTIFVVEALILTFAGVACLIKGGFFLRDKK
jgi:hypothetical protein